MDYIANTVHMHILVLYKYICEYILYISYLCNAFRFVLGSKDFILFCCCCCFPCAASLVCPSFSTAYGNFTFTLNTTAQANAGTRVRVQCYPGYVPIEGSQDYICDTTGTWRTDAGIPHAPGCGRTLVIV